MIDFSLKQDLDLYSANTNTLLVKFSAYLDTVLQSGSDLPYILNPKYKEDQKTFARPIRLEQMMQDICYFFKEEKVHLYVQRRNDCFSAIKNKAHEVMGGLRLPYGAEEPDHFTASKNEAVYFYSIAKKLSEEGENIFYDSKRKVCQVFDLNDSQAYPFSFIARLVLPSHYLLSSAKRRNNIKNCCFESDSYLVVEGEGDIFLNEVTLKKGTGMEFHLGKGVCLEIDKVELKNDGFQYSFIGQQGGSQDEEIRGFKLEKKEWPVIKITQAGRYRFFFENGKHQIFKVE